MENEVPIEIKLDSNLYVDDFGSSLIINIVNYKHIQKTKIHLTEDEITIFQNGECQRIWLKPEDIIQITIGEYDSDRGLLSSIYRSRDKEITKLVSFYYHERIETDRKTYSYKLCEFIAEKIALRYGVQWEYRISVDDPESTAVGYFILFFIGLVFLSLLMICFII